MRPGTTAFAKPFLICSIVAPRCWVAKAVAKAFSWLNFPSKRMSKWSAILPLVVKSCA